MNRVFRLSALVLAGVLAFVAEARAQRRAYIGFAYPAGGQQGTTVRVRLGGQRLTGVYAAIVSGRGVQAKLVDYHRRISNQDRRLLREQLKELTRRSAKKTPATQKLAAKIRARMAAYVNRPACASLSELAFVDVTISADAEPGPREIRLVTSRDISNPVPFIVGQVPEVARKPMKTCPTQVLGKEYLALRKRPAEEEEVRVTLPCTTNGQIASGEVNRYRFEARKGQQLVITTAARQLVPYIADAVPGWFQPVLTLRDADGKEVAFNDDYRFKPDPTILFEVPKTGEYVLTIADAIYRGREDFVYRITIGEQPFVTSIFPLGGRAGRTAKAQVQGWNLSRARPVLPGKSAPPGVYHVVAKGRQFLSNQVPFALDTLPEYIETESAKGTKQGEDVKLPVIINGRSDRPDDEDVFRFAGKAGQVIVAEVMARRLDSPMDSMIRLTDPKGRTIAFNDDHEDPGTGLNTHHADSYLMAKLPATGTYGLHITDTARQGGPAYAYRLRISPPRPDFALRTEPSRVTMRGKKGGSINVYAIRKDGYTGPIALRVKDSAKDFYSSKATLKANQEKTRLYVRTKLKQTKLPVDLHIEGRATIDGKNVVHEAVPAEDRMQAFLWRHLVPAQDLKVLVSGGSYSHLPKREPPNESAKPKVKPKEGAAKYSERQIRGLLRQLRRLYDEWLISESFYLRKVAEYEAGL